jgi:glyoxylate carboligase
MKTVADRSVETLAAAGVKRVYGVGDSLNGLTDAIRRHGKIEWVYLRNEETSAFAAGAETHLTGELAGARAAAGPATCISSTGCSIITVRACRCPASPRTSLRARLAAATSRSPHPQNYSIFRGKVRPSSDH